MIDFSYRRHPLDVFFSPRNVAIIGASEKEGSVGRTLIWNLLSSPFGGAVYPINPKRKNVLGVHAYASISDAPDQIDLAIIATPARSVPNIIEECEKAGVKGAIVISAGFKEIGEEGVLLEQEILRKARQAKMRIVGPNCLGIMSPITGLNATFAKGMARKGNVGFISQSGALLTAILDWSQSEQVGFSAFASVGSMLDVDWSDLLYYLGDDHHTKSIVIYMESIGNPRAFLSAAREVSLSKPIIVIKAGRTAQAAQAAASHTGSMTGSDEVLDAAFRRSGVLRVERIADVFAMAEVLSKQPRPRGPNLTIVTNAGGPGVLATDALIQGGGQLTPLSEELLSKLNECLPDPWSHNNPIDILGDASAKRYADTIEIITEDSSSDGLLVVLTPQDMTNPTETAQNLQQVIKDAKYRKPLLASWMGGDDVEAGVDILNKASIPTFKYPDTAARTFTYMWQYTLNLRSIYETPVLPSKRLDLRDQFTNMIKKRFGTGAAEFAKRKTSETLPEDRQQYVDTILETISAEGRTLLTEYEAKQIIAAYGIPTVETVLAETVDEAVEQAKKIGYPVVLKLNSRTITHKTDVNGVQLDLRDEQAVRKAFQTIQSAVRKQGSKSDFEGVAVQPMEKLDGYELIIGSSIDQQFGPVLLFGSGGTLVEVLKDRALGLPPLNSTLAKRMMERTLIYQALQGIRGRKPVDLEALASILVQFSQLVVEQPRVKEIDINPLLARADSLLALDARIVLHDTETPNEDLPKSAIRPYPSQYVKPWTLPTGEELIIRPIRPEDEPQMGTFNQTISPGSIYLRYFRPMSPEQLVSHEQLARMCFIDYDREISLVAERNDGHGKQEVIAMGQLTKLHGSDDAEFAILVRDNFQRTGLGTELLTRLLDIARDEGLKHVVAEILPQNEGMRRVCKKLGFTFTHDIGDGLIHAEIEL